ncbi:MAG TPA: phosphotransferase [Candidatus Binatia bacterium]|nr:phosphotransferase [Candidatus Binatia bacterium]
MGVVAVGVEQAQAGSAGKKGMEGAAKAHAFATDVVARRWPGASLERIEALRGDASTRSYLRAWLDVPAGASAPPTVVIMVLQDSSVAMSSEELSVFGTGGPKELPFVNVARFLSRHTDALPALYGVAADASLIVLEDVGDVPLWDAARTGDAEELFGSALDQIAALQARAVDDGSGCYAFGQAFDERLFAWEFEHFLEFGIGAAPTSLVQASRDELHAVARRLDMLPRVFAHRDYHAWNIHYWQGRLRFIDFQDALLAPALYDVASLMTDRMTPEIVVPELAERLLRRFYENQSAGRLESFEETRASYMLLALQRVLKVVGRFNYLADVKGKPAYRAMLPVVCSTARQLLSSADGVGATAELFALAVRDGSDAGVGAAQ